MRGSTTKRIKKTFAKSVGISPWQTQMGFYVFLALSVILISLSLISKDFSSLVKNTAYSVVTPVMKTVTAPVYAVRDGFDMITDLTSLRAENEQLLQENQKLKDWYFAAQSLKAENVRLQSMVGYVDRLPEKFMTTRVIADVSDDFAQSYLLPIGEADGVEESQAVLSENAFIGRVVEVQDNFSRVMLINDINSRIPVLVEGLELRAVLAGNNDDKGQLLYLPKDHGVKPGMRIVTSGHGGLLPANLEIGVVKQTNAGDAVFVDFTKQPDRANLVHLLKFDPVKDGN